jgi:Zn-dependent peptidase ImmA (M78 family)/formiminotetrahydrofolate cyclodeaminase
MDTELMELKTRDLLVKYGKGNHIPGSGSAAAELGLVSAQLLRTVIRLTDNPEHPKRQEKYSQWLPELRRIASEIDNRILPKLEELFQTDSNQFNKAIDLRKKRDSEKDIAQKSYLATQAVEELKPSTIIPVEIAKLCIELADFAKYVFTHGFKSARGDAGVAQSGAIASVGGCISIVYLNLLSFASNAWVDLVREEISLLRDKYQQLTLDAIICVDVLKEEADMHNQCQGDIRALLASLPDESRLNDSIIEEIATKLQLLLWKHKETIWKQDEIDDPLKILQPDTALKEIGYHFYRLKFIERHEVNGEFLDVAGLIDKEQKFVQVSQEFGLSTQNFTAAHELGHALFHKQAILHRDKPLDGSSSTYTQDRREIQANKFAAFFLMPQKQVVKIFKELFSMERFTVTGDNVFALTNDNVAAFREIFKNKREVARFLGGPLAEIFEVSIETMAIRLEELNLVDY